MNERIRELRAQAWTLVSNEERDRGELYEVREQWERCDQKFAELIVRECARICAKQAWESRTNDDWTEYNALSRVAGQIKQHFGVEE